MATIESYTLKPKIGVDGRPLKPETRYRVRYRTPDRRQTDKRGFKTRKAAEAFANRVEVDKATGQYVDASAGRITIGELGPGWLDRRANLKPSSARTMESAWRVHVEPEWGEVPIANIRHTDVQAWVAAVGKERGPVTVIRAYGVLAAILDDAVKDRRIAVNPARGVKLPRKVKREHAYLSDAQVLELATESGETKAVIVGVLGYCGLRWGELAGLHVADVDMLRRRLHIRRNAVNVGGKVVVGTPKTHERRVVPFPKFLAEPIAAACKGRGRDDIVFPNETGGYAKSPGANTWFSGAVGRCAKAAVAARQREEKAGGEATTPVFPKITPHDLRHTAASLAVSAGANVKAVQKMLGHASAAMTLDTYADLFDDDADAVANAHDQRVSPESVGKVWARGN